MPPPLPPLPLPLRPHSELIASTMRVLDHPTPTKHEPLSVTVTLETSVCMTAASILYTDMSMHIASLLAGNDGRFLESAAPVAMDPTYGEDYLSMEVRAHNFPLRILFSQVEERQGHAQNSVPHWVWTSMQIPSNPGCSTPRNKAGIWIKFLYPREFTNFSIHPKKRCFLLSAWLCLF